MRKEKLLLDMNKDITSKRENVKGTERGGEREREKERKRK